MSEGKHYNKVFSNYYMDLFSKCSFSKMMMYTITMVSVVLYIDINDIPSCWIKVMGLRVFLVVVLAVTLFLLTLIIESDYLKLFIIPSINICDVILHISFASVVSVLLLSRFLLINAAYKLLVGLGGIVFAFIMIVIRQRKHRKAFQKADCYISNTIDLKDLYENNIPKAEGIVFLDEKEVDYDLLNRKSIINYLYDIICSCNPDKHFVIGLEGKWGDGKTTILRNVQRMVKEKNPDILIIDDFDPWLCGNEESILENFFECVLNNCGIRVNSLELQKNINKLIQVAIDSERARNILSSVFVTNKSISECKKRINEYLKLCDKKIVVYIDNLDRVAEDKLFFVFKIIGTILDFERVIYVVSYDSDKVKNIFEKKLAVDYNYLKKIIQLQINVPKIDSGKIEDIIKVSTLNLLQVTNNSENVTEYGATIDCFSKNIHDLRDYKRVVNSVIIKNLYSKSNLSSKDKIIIDYIKMFNFELYQSIIQNRQYYISDDIMYDMELYTYSLRKEQLEKDTEAFFHMLFENQDNAPYMNLLEEIFPKVSRYNKNMYGYPARDPVKKKRGIASALYFDLYFTETENEFSLMGGEIEKFVKEVNENVDSTADSFYKLIKAIPVELQREMLETIQLYIANLSSDACYELAIAIFDYIWEINNSPLFFMLSARRRASVIICELLQKIEEQQYLNFLEKIETAYDKIEIVNNITYWFEHDYKGKSDKSRLAKWNELEETLVVFILQNNINLYDDKYYHHENIWGLCRNLKDKEDEFKDYIRDKITCDSIFRILYDAMSQSVGTAHRYYFNTSNLEVFFDMGNLTSFMKKVKPKSQDEQFILEVYERYLENPKDDMGDSNGICVSEEKKIIL